MDHLDYIINNNMMKETHEFQLSEIFKIFPQLINSSNRNILSLYQYIVSIPQCYYSKSIYNAYLEYLNILDTERQQDLIKYLDDWSNEFNSAILHLIEINSLDWHDDIDDIEDLELIRFIDQKLHPTYLRLIESVFFPIGRIVAHFSRLDRNKNTDDLNDLWPIIEEINKTQLNIITKPYKHLMRNAIAHGGITYFKGEINYKDKKGNNENIPINMIIKNFDDLLDICNSIVLALRLFLLINLQRGYTLFNQFLIEELQQETRTPWWNITACIPTSMNYLNQLIIYARTNTIDYRKVQISTFQTGILAEKFTSGYDRYFVSISSNTSIPGWAAFDGKKLKGLRNKNTAILEDYKDVVEDGLIFFIPKFKLPRLFFKFHSIYLSFKIHWPLYISNFRRELNKPNIVVKKASIHRNSWGVVLNGSVFFCNFDSQVTQENIRKHKKKIIKKILKYSRRKLSIFNLLRYLPLGYTRIFVYSQNLRIRQLHGLDKNLICTIQVKRINRIRAMDILNSEIETIGAYRIAWNREWLKNI